MRITDNDLAKHGLVKDEINTTYERMILLKEELFDPYKTLEPLEYDNQ
jgi:hypothetical protein